jgi:hypothetical protein
MNILSALPDENPTDWEVKLIEVGPINFQPTLYSPSRDVSVKYKVLSISLEDLPTVLRNNVYDFIKEKTKKRLEQANAKHRKSA